MDPSDHDLLIELNVKMDALLKGFNGHEQRLTVLEEWKWKWAGAFGLLVLVVSILGNLVGQVVTGR